MTQTFSLVALELGARVCQCIPVWDSFPYLTQPVPLECRAPCGLLDCLRSKYRMYNRIHQPNPYVPPSSSSNGFLNPGTWRETDGWGRTLRPQLEIENRTDFAYNEENWPRLGRVSKNFTESGLDSFHTRPKHILSFDQFLRLRFGKLPTNVWNLGQSFLPPHLKWGRGNPVPIPTPIDGGRTTSNNSDPALDLAKSMAKLVQIKHHLANWSTLPLSLRGKVSLITENLCPPLINDKLLVDYRTAGQKFGEDLVQITTTHLLGKTKALEDILSRADRTYVPLASSIAAKLLMDRFGKRLPPRIRNLLGEVEILVGSSLIVNLRAEELNSNVSDSDLIDLNTVKDTMVNSNIVPVIPNHIPNLPVSNRFQVLEVDDIESMEAQEPTNRKRPATLESSLNCSGDTSDTSSVNRPKKKTAKRLTFGDSDLSPDKSDTSLLQSQPNRSPQSVSTCKWSNNLDNECSTNPDSHPKPNPNNPNPNSNPNSIHIPNPNSNFSPNPNPNPISNPNPNPNSNPNPDPNPILDIDTNPNPTPTNRLTFNTESIVVHSTDSYLNLRPRCNPIVILEKVTVPETSRGAEGGSSCQPDMEAVLTPKARRVCRIRSRLLKDSTSTCPGQTDPLIEITGERDGPGNEKRPHDDSQSSEDCQSSEDEINLLEFPDSPPANSEPRINKIVQNNLNTENSSQKDPSPNLGKSGQFLERRNKIDPLDILPKTKCLLVGDSNLRLFRPVPIEWQVICIPGLHLSQLAAILKYSYKPPNLKHIIVSTGINDRDSGEVGPLIDCLKAGRAQARTIHFQSIVASRNLTLRQINNITRINKTARDLDFVKVIPSHTVTPTFTDTAHIHYDEKTSQQIFEGIISHITSLNSN